MPVLDSGSYTVVRDVPLVDTVELNRDGKHYDLDDAFLHDVVANHYRREKETGDLPVVIVGHNSDDQLGDKPIHGYAKGLRVQPLANSNRNAIYGDIWVHNDFAPNLKSFPRRSAELWYGAKQLDAIALLGATPPQRDLGLLAFSKSTSDIKLSHEISNMPPAVDDNPDTVADKGDGMPKWAADLVAGQKELLAAIQAMAPKGEPDAPEGAEGGSDDDAELEKLLAELEGGSQGAQGQPQAKPPVVEQKDEVKLSRLTQENAKLKADLAERDLRDKLVALQRSGYTLDVDAEVKLLMPLDPETRKVFLSRIETNFPKAPVSGQRLEGLDDSTISGSKRPYDAKAQAEVKAKALKLGRFEDAFFEVMGQTTTDYYKGN